MYVFLFFLYIAIPLAALAFFIVSIVRFVKCPRDSVDERKKRRRTLIFSGIPTFSYILSLIGFTILALRAVMSSM